MKQFKAAQSLRVRYIVGLSAIALLVTASYMTLQRLVSEQRNFSTLVNMAGHQSGLANRIAYFSSLMATTEDESEFSMAKSQVGRTIHKMEENHRVLRSGDPEEGIPYVTNENLEHIYDDPMVGLELALERYLERARRVYETPMEALDTGSGGYIFLTTYGPHVLEPMFDAAVDEYEQIGQRSILRIEKLELGIWIASLATLLLEVLLIFRPLERRIRESITSLEATVSRLRSTQERLVAAQRLAAVGDWEWDPGEDHLAWSEAIYTICGRNPGTFPLTPEAALEVVHPEDRDGVREAFRRIRETGEACEFEHRVIRPDGSERLVFQQAVARRDDHHGVTRLAGIIQDITERKELSSRLEKISRNVPGFIYQFHQRPDGSSCFPYASPRIADLFDVSPEEVAEDAARVFATLHEDDLERVEAGIQESAEALTPWRDQFRVHHRVKGMIWVEGDATPERLADGGTLWHGYLLDVTRRKRSEDQIRELALFDPLTGLPNRRLLQDRMDQALASARRSGQLGVFVMLDLDHFKGLNDTRGHGAGDALLVEVGRRLRASVRETDTVARVGGDEFVAVLEDLGPTELTARQEAQGVAEKLRAVLCEPYYPTDAEHPFHTSASIGITLFDGRGADVEEIHKQADVAMFEAKDSGRNRVCFFNEERQATINSRTAMGHALRRALDEGEFTLYYQPQVSPGGHCVGAEALLRWPRASGEAVGPGTFIPVAEDTGLILPLGDWVLETVCRQLGELEALALPAGFAVAVNISARQFSEPGFLQRVRDITGESGIALGRLKLELTETSLFQDPVRARRVVDALREMGLRIELDDFGTGYSSLTSLKSLPLDTLKLDGSLVRDIEGGGSGPAILRAAIAMARALSLEVVAEGVETDAQRRFLVEEGCDVLQGYLFDRPMPYADLVARLAAQYVDPPAVRQA